MQIKVKAGFLDDIVFVRHILCCLLVFTSNASVKGHVPFSQTSSTISGFVYCCVQDVHIGSSWNEAAACQSRMWTIWLCLHTEDWPRMLERLTSCVKLNQANVITELLLSINITDITSELRTRFSFLSWTSTVCVVLLLQFLSLLFCCSCETFLHSNKSHTWHLRSLFLFALLKANPLYLLPELNCSKIVLPDLSFMGFLPSLIEIPDSQTVELSVPLGVSMQLLYSFLCFLQLFPMVFGHVCPQV